MNISLELIRLQKKHEGRGLSYRDSLLLKAKFLADKFPPPGVTRRNSKKRAVRSFVQNEEAMRHMPVPVMDGPSDSKRIGW